MADVKWIKIVTDIFDDEKILLIESLPDADSIIVCWFKLLCLAGKQNNSGVLMLNERVAYTEEMLATVFRRPLQTVRLALETFEQFGMVEIINGAITIPNWGKHQNLEGIEKVREQTRERVSRYRERQKLLTDSNVTEALRVTGCNGTDIDIDKNRIDLDKKKRRFTPPSFEEVAAYCQERNNTVNPQSFIDFYSAKGWKIGKDKMTDWKAAVRTWESREKADQEQKTAKRQRQYLTAVEYKEMPKDTAKDIEALKKINADLEKWGVTAE